MLGSVSECLIICAGMRSRAARILHTCRRRIRQYVSWKRAPYGGET